MARRRRHKGDSTHGVPQPVYAVVMPDLGVLLHPGVDLIVPHHVRVARRSATTGAHVVCGRRVRVAVDRRRPVDPGRRRRGHRGRRVQRVDEPNPSDTRLGIRPALNVSTPGGPGHPAPAAEETTAGLTAAREGGQLVGERRGVAPVVVPSTGVQQGADGRPNVDERVARGRPDQIGFSTGKQHRSVRRNLNIAQNTNQIEAAGIE